MTWHDPRTDGGESTETETDQGCCGGQTAAASDESSLSPSEQRRAVRQRYGPIAADGDDGGRCDESEPAADAGCGTDATCCPDESDGSQSGTRGYSREEIESVAAGANLELGCGNPTAIASLEEGETVLDLGSGGGFDCFLAAREVGEDGRVIGVDMTPEMVERARANVAKNDADSVEFRLGEIEHLPVPDAHVDAIISNCVINLSPNKGRVFEEASRVLRPGGRLAIADVVKSADVPVDFGADPDSVAGCVAGAAAIDELRDLVETAGFESVSIRPKDDSREFIREWSDEHPLESYFVSAVIEAEKPATTET